MKRKSYGALILVAVLTAASGAAAQKPAVAPPSDDALGGDGNLGVLREPGGLTADAAAVRAVATSATLAQARATQRVAEAASERALISAFPRLSASARYTRLSNVRQGSIGSDALTDEQQQDINDLIDGVSDPNARALFQGINSSLSGFSSFEFPLLVNQYAFNVGLTIPLSEILLTLMPAYSATAAYADAEALRVTAEKQNVALAARRAYYAYVQARAALRVAESTSVQVTSQRDQVRILVDGGTLPRVDLTRLEAQLAAADVAVTQSRGNAAVAAYALRSLLHMPAKDNGESGGRIAIDADLTAVPDAGAKSRTQLVEQALENRAELQAMRRLHEGDDHSVTAYGWQRAPKLSLGGNVDVANPNQRVFPQTDAFRTTWDVSATLSWSPNDFFMANAQTSSAQAVRAQSAANIRALEDSTTQEVLSAFENLASARASLDAAAKSVQAATETHRVREQQLAEGAIIATDLIDAENELAKARLAQINAVIAVHVAGVTLAHATGAP